MTYKTKPPAYLIGAGPHDDAEREAVMYAARVECGPPVAPPGKALEGVEGKLSDLLDRFESHVDALEALVARLIAVQPSPQADVQRSQQAVPAQAAGILPRIHGLMRHGDVLAHRMSNVRQLLTDLA